MGGEDITLDRAVLVNQYVSALPTPVCVWYQYRTIQVSVEPLNRMTNDPSGSGRLATQASCSYIPAEQMVTIYVLISIWNDVGIFIVE